MPVPVPLFSKPLAHPVIKKNNNGGDGQTNPFQHLTRTLPVSPTGPPPSFGTREQWINSLPSWRRTKPRRIWEDDFRFVAQRAERDFFQGLAAADNASVIKGEHAEACIPPLPILPAVETPTELPPSSDGDADDEMSSGYSAVVPTQLDHGSQRRTSPLSGNNSDSLDVRHQSQLQGVTALTQEGINTADDEPMYERGAFTPVFEDESSGTASCHDPGSSPLEPVTPFGEFVDRAIATTQTYSAIDNAYPSVGLLDQELQYDHPDQHSGPQCYPAQPLYEPIVEPPKERASTPEVATPSATASYKKLAEPLSDWIANYMWKVCTMGLSLPSEFSRSSDSVVKQYANSPPVYLASAVHSLLLSTLLQPSAVFLSIWYIVRLPVFFGTTCLGADHDKEIRFRVALLGEDGSLDREAMEASAPFRLIVLGCMLANKWLDDHTFSNKTWHTISNVPIQVLNQLESSALDIFSYDLSVPSHEWSQWLSRIMSYHLSLCSPAHPQPISRPSTNPHSIIRKAIDEIIQAPAAYISNASCQPQPVFLGLEERRKANLEKELALTVDVLEIDLDQDGPLREEYLPKRRVSGAGSSHNYLSGEEPSAPKLPADKVQDWERCDVSDGAKPLPPPARWSPAGDEPILRERNRNSGQYVAVQPPLVNSIAPFQVLPPPYNQAHELAYMNQNWSAVGSFGHVKQQPATGYVLDIPSLHASQPTYNSYPFVLPVSSSHSRSQSLSYDQGIPLLRSHLRSYSQSRFEYRCSDIRMTANEFAPFSGADTQWTAAGHHTYAAAAFAPQSGVNYQPAWLST